MNKKVKIATLVAFTVAFSVFSVKPAAALDLGKAVGGALKSTGKAANEMIKASDKLTEAKGPLKYIEISDIPSEYNGYYAQMMAPVIDNPLDVCMPPYLTPGYRPDDNTPAMVDSVNTGELTVRIPCDDKKRMLSLILSKTKNENNTSTGGWIYAKGTGLDGCKSKATMPTYKLSERQKFSFKDFVKNEDCNAVADKEKSKSKK
ncbi:MAG: hypothetical protein LBC87_12745 [Fibromonadaceae bacterium]|jgi:hypothetical protein|nr:hypothetical protein [Fibromonadaceae bacterium]